MFAQLKVLVRNLVTLLYTKLINLNAFPLWDFGSHVDRMTAIRLGQWATRLHIILFAIGFAILAVYTVIRPQTLTKTFDKPTFNLYNHLKRHYGDKLECLCSSIASKHNRYVDVKPVFHEVRKDTIETTLLKEYVHLRSKYFH